MALPVLIPLISAVMSSLIARDQQKEATWRANQKADEISDKNIAMQKEFAQSGIRWRVADAKAAGLHPLAALGTQGASFSPVHQDVQADFSSADMTRSMGQDISRAMQAALSNPEKQLNKLQLASAQAQLEGLTLDNQLKASRLRQLNDPSPGVPSNSGLGGLSGQQYVNEVASKITHAAPGHQSQQAGKITDLGWTQTKTGLAPVPSVDVKERIEDQIFPETMWAMRNYLMPNLGQGDHPPKHLLPKGYDFWSWNPFKQEYQPRKSRMTRKQADQFKNWRK